MIMLRRSKLICLFLLIPFRIFASDLVVSISGKECEATVGQKNYECSISMVRSKDRSKPPRACVPVGVFPLRQVYIRTDKIASDKLQNLQLRTLALQRFDGWCLDPNSIDYNKWVDLTRFNPLLQHKKLYRKDDLYDIVIVAGNNDDPIVPGKGSVIFVHVDSDGGSRKNGCLAFSEEDLLEILPQLNENSKLIVKDN